jgi:hypothetical protein
VLHTRLQNQSPGKSTDWSWWGKEEPHFGCSVRLHLAHPSSFRSLPSRRGGAGQWGGQPAAGARDVQQAVRGARWLELVARERRERQEASRRRDPVMRSKRGGAGRSAIGDCGPRAAGFHNAQQAGRRRQRPVVGARGPRAA